MIRLTRIRDEAHLKGFTGAALQEKLEKLLGYYFSDPGKGVDFKIKSRHVWKTAKNSLKIESHNKCAYCEADTATVAYGDVEHFRPKDHYWWLSYCYDNFAFSCQVCNQSYKGANFPVDQQRLARPKLPRALPTDVLKLSSYAKSLSPDPFVHKDNAITRLFRSELAHLPNPYQGQPEKLFGWKVTKSTKEVHVVPRKGSVRSTKAVVAAEKFLGINRSELLRVRFLHYESLETMVSLFQDSKYSPSAQKKMLARIQRMGDNDQPFAGMKRFFLRQWGLID
ncbi:hypothetical protein AWB77_04556 [Caballeronia fortuita]|uniref:HNH nuclease domain-containing protein n=1 Tax=Caballeronia fortuita TaxID=1777138 RepID=A0A158CUK5_9BURK|nr:hypothetical protein [Caballeronia fortuita]SAK86004.1 hypothetical protein AWB77_04556 [Caballeronia fortuita]